VRRHGRAEIEEPATMLVPHEDLSKHAAVLQCIAYDFRELAAHYRHVRAYQDFASQLEHIAASLIVTSGHARASATSS
jgi:hypothetical protein